MAVLQMQRISICALKKERKPILEKIQKLGVLERNQVDTTEVGFETVDTLSERQTYDRWVNHTENALAILEQYVPEKAGMFASLEGKPLTSEEEFKDVIGKEHEILETADKIILSSKKIAEYKANLLKFENAVESLKPWLPLEVPMNYEGTKHVAMMVGTIAGEQTLEGLYERLVGKEVSPDDVEIQIIYADVDVTNFATFCLRRDESRVEEALRGIGFSRPSNVVTEIPAKKMDMLQDKIALLNQQIAQAEEEIIAQKDSKRELQYISDYFRMRSDKYSVLGTLPHSQRTFVISGYTTERGVLAIQKSLEQYNCFIETEDLKEDEEPPVLLKNSSFSSSVEGVLEAFGLPQKGEMDPTTIMSFFYVFFFGLMLSDAAYGAIMAIGCFIVLKKFPRMNAGLHKNIKMFMLCGLSTVFWGVMFGGYFSDIIQIVALKYFHTVVVVKPLWFAPLDDPMKLLTYSMLFGLIHLFTGLALKGYMLIKDGHILDALFDVGFWFIFLAGLLMLLLPSSIFEGISGVKIVYSETMKIVAKVLAIGGAGGILIFSARATKNFGLRLALGAYDLYNVSGWLSDVLSYSRLLALGLATGVIASVINQMASMGHGVLGVAVLIIGFIGGHLFNLAINVLGAYVHTNRLQFVEFFGKFYEGGGRAFAPFKSNTKYVDIKEEK
jgi:V/A-type H+-transporting ATPase subunit I